MAMLVKEQIQNLINEICGISDVGGQNFEGIKLIDDLGFDSIGLIQLIGAIEQEFGIQFDDEKIIDIINDFDELVIYVNELLENKYGK